MKLFHIYVDGLVYSKCVFSSLLFSCTGIPEAFLNKVVAKKHFGQFGRIRNFILRPGKYSCVVEYETANEAENAFLEGGIYNGYQFDISYTEEPSKMKQTEEFIDPDVQDELNAMNPALKKPAFSSFMPPPSNRSSGKFILDDSFTFGSKMIRTVYVP